MAVLIVAAILAAVVYRRVQRRHHASGRAARVSRSRYRALVAVAFVLGCQLVISAPPAFADECGQAPNPQTPGAGLIGSIDSPHPATTANSDPYDQYDRYGYAGMVWYTYQADCGPLHALTDPTNGLDTDTGNFLLNGAKGIVGTTNGLDRAVTDSSLMGPIYNAVQTGANRVYNNVFLQLLALCALLLSLVLLRAAWRGDLAAVSRRTLTMLGGLWLAASSLVLLRYLEPVDKAVVGFSTDIQAGFTPDASVSANRDQFARDLHKQIIYTTWLRGEFGAPNVPQADQYGRRLLDAQAFTVAEHDKHDDTNQAVIDRKKHEYTDIAGQLGASTDTFTGDAGGRAGAGLLALLQAVTYALFPLLAKLTVLLAQVIFRLIIITSPMLGLAALLHPDVLRTLARVAATVLFNLLVISVLAGTHTLILQAVFAGGFPVSVQILITGIVTAILVGVARPLRRLRQTLQAPTGALGELLPATRGGLLAKFRKAKEIVSRYDQFMKEAHKPVNAWGLPEAESQRPENSSENSPLSQIENPPNAVPARTLTTTPDKSKSSNKGRFPLGFTSSDHFSNFGTSLKRGLHDAGYPDAVAIFHGSSVTGVSFKEGIPFDEGRISDFDIAIVSSTALLKAKELGYKLRSKGERTGPLKERELKQLGLFELAARLSDAAGRSVNFMIYGSEELATSRAASIMVP